IHECILCLHERNSVPRPICLILYGVPFEVHGDKITIHLYILSAIRNLVSPHSREGAGVPGVNSLARVGRALAQASGSRPAADRRALKSAGGGLFSPLTRG